MVALPLIHTCGAQVDYAVSSSGAPFGKPVISFSDSQTDDPLHRCPRCGAPLYEAYVAGEMKPLQVKPSAPTARRTGEAARARGRDAAAAKIAQAIAGVVERRAAKAAA